MSYDFSALRPFASPTQITYLDALEGHGGIMAASRALGRHHSTLQESLKLLKKRAAAHGVAPEFGLTREAPEPFIVRGHSILDRVHPDGSNQMLLRWTKTRLDDEQWVQAVKEGISAFINDVGPIVSAPKIPAKLDKDLIPWINIGDAHLGMLAHEAETGANFDLKLAELELVTAIHTLIDEAPATERIVINDLGDFTHYENMAGVTEASGHALDYDGRFPKMIKVYSRLMRSIIDKALTKAHYVDVIVNQGNHSRTNDLWMAELLRVAYAKTGRVNVLNNDSVFIGYRMSRTFVMTHHSDKCRPKDLVHVMSTDFRKDWGEAEYCYIDIGHIHHAMAMKEHPGVTVESFNILAPRDKWAHEHGYRSRQSITMVLRSRSYGEVGRRVLPIRQVQERIHSLAQGSSHYVAPELRAFCV